MLKKMFSAILSKEVPCMIRIFGIVLIVYLLAITAMFIYGASLPVLVLCNTLRIAVVMCTIWAWADILFLSEYAWLRDRRKDPRSA